MATIVGLKINNKVSYFLDEKNLLKVGDLAVADNDCGQVISINDIKNVTKLKNITRKATEEDIKIYKENCEIEKKAMEVCKNRIKENNLDMKLIDVKYMLDRSKLLFFFSAENRVDFRNLVKELAAIFKVRIELRQIGVRDEARFLGGLGICGRPFCCSTFLNSFQPVSIKMAKEQNLSLNPVKISGTCGRLMCCLKYEQDVYSKILKTMPKVGSTVKTPEGPGIIIEQNILKNTVKVKLDNAAPEALPLEFDIKEIN